jgi:hypothetical protein
MKPIKILNEDKNSNTFAFQKEKKSKLIFLFIFFILYTIFLLYIFSLKTINISNKNIQNFSNIELLKLLTNNNQALYNGVENCLGKNPDDELCIYQYICPKEVKGKKRILIGNKRDGSYVMLDDFDNIKIAYSIGIYKYIQFDKALADKGIEVYMYDHTINNLPYENDKFHWKKIGLGGNSQRSNNIQTLEEMLKENGHIFEKNMILKIDIEYAEWDSLIDVSENIIRQFKYILIEFHFFKDNLIQYYNVLKKLYKTHQVFYINCSDEIATFGNNRFCRCIEVSYIQREGNKFEKDKVIYPIPEFYFGKYGGFNINILKLFDV